MTCVSIIIPTFNRFDLLGHALDSLLSQTLQDFEVIVVDDGSTDNTKQLAESYCQVRYVRLEHSGLPALVRNSGLRIAHGNYVAFLDSDDQWLPQKLERQVAILDKYPNVGLVCSNALILEDNKNTGQLYLREGQGRSGWVLKELLKDNFVITSTAVVRRSMLEQVGVFEETTLLRALEDHDLWLRIAAVSEVYYIPEPLALYRNNPASIRAQQSRISYWQGMLLILERLRQHLKDWGYQDPLIEQVIDDQSYDYRQQLLNAYLADDQYFDAVKCVLQLIRQRPVNAFKFGYKVVRKGLRFRALIKGRSTSVKDLWHRYGKAETARGMKGVSKRDSQGIKLHLGCGETYLPGYINIDFPPSQHTVQKQPKADLYADIRQLSYPSESVEEIRLHHVFEHFDRPTALRLLIDWYEWLKEGGSRIIWLRLK